MGRSAFTENDKCVEMLTTGTSYAHRILIHKSNFLLQLFSMRIFIDRTRGDTRPRTVSTSSLFVDREKALTETRAHKFNKLRSNGLTMERTHLEVMQGHAPLFCTLHVRSALTIVQKYQVDTSCQYI